jgi:hypothetical protein
MAGHMEKFLFLLAGLPLLMLASGCLSDAELRQRRIQENHTLFSQLGTDVRQHVAAGSIAVGDPQVAVWLAWGEPDSKSYIVNASGNTECWLYARLAPETCPVLVVDPPPPYGVPPPRFAPAHCEYRTRYVPIPSRRVDFQNGVVVQIQFFQPHPQGIP